MEKLTLQELEAHLWRAADILRGKIESAEYKSYIFGLLFFKRLSDVYEEEYEQLLKKHRNKQLAKDKSFHRFQIPSGCFWKSAEERK